MVTTIKITCDGVFIQSNTLFTNAQLRYEATSHTGHNELITAKNRYFRAIDSNEVVPAVNGNVTVVIKNNRRKIDRTMLHDMQLQFENTNSDGHMLDKSRFKLVEPPVRNGREKCSDGSETVIGQSVARIRRPPYHNMYMVRKVSATRASIRGNVTATPTPMRRTELSAEKHCNGSAVMMLEGNRSHAVANSTAVAYNGVSVTMMSLGAAADYSRGVSDLSRRRSSSPVNIQSALVVDIGQ